MQGHHQYQPELFSQIDYQQLIPLSHLLRRIDRVLDLGFLPEVTKPFYVEEKGRPSIAPEVFVRMVLLQALYGIDSDRQLCEEVGYNLAYRWFCKLSLTDRVPDHSSITRIRDRFGEETFAVIFNRVLKQCQKAGLVKAEQIMVDGSTMRANASIYNMVEREVEKPKVDDIDANQPGTPIYSKDGLSNNDFRQRQIEGKKISNKTHVSKSDPESGLSGKAFEAKSLAYKTHCAIDADSRVIIDCHVTAGSVSEVKVLESRIDAIEKNLAVKIEEVIADRGYGSGENLEFLEKREIRSNIPLWSSRSGMKFFKELEDGFVVNEDGSEVQCPEGYNMKRGSHDDATGRWMFTLPRSCCQACPRAKTCLSESEYKTRGKKFALIDRFKTIMATREKSTLLEFKAKLWQRMWKMEGIFAEAKNNHGLRRARYRGRWKVQVQVYMISTVQNLKRLAGAVFDGVTVILVNFMKTEFSRAYFKKSTEAI
jgi:transposase